MVQTMKDIKKDTSQIEDMNVRLFATEAVTKENVHDIKKLRRSR